MIVKNLKQVTAESGYIQCTIYIVATRKRVENHPRHSYGTPPDPFRICCIRADCITSIPVNSPHLNWHFADRHTHGTCASVYRTEEAPPVVYGEIATPGYANHRFLRALRRPAASVGAGL